VGGDPLLRAPLYETVTATGITSPLDILIVNDTVCPTVNVPCVPASHLVVKLPTFALTTFGQFTSAVIVVPGMLMDEIVSASPPAFANSMINVTLLLGTLSSSVTDLMLTAALDVWVPKSPKKYPPAATAMATVTAIRMTAAMTGDNPLFAVRLFTFRVPLFTRFLTPKMTEIGTVFSPFGCYTSIKQIDIPIVVMKFARDCVMTFDIKRYATPAEVGKYLDDEIQRSKNVVAEYLRELKELQERTTQEKKTQDAFVRMLGGRSKDHKDSGARSHEAKLGGLEIMINPSAEKEQMFLEQVVEAIQRKLDALQKAQKSLGPLLSLRETGLAMSISVITNFDVPVAVIVKTTAMYEDALQKKVSILDEVRKTPF